MTDRMEQNAAKILTECMGAKQGETCLIVCDNSKRSISQCVYEAASNLKLKAMLFNMGNIDRSGQEPPKAVAEAMKYSDIVLCLTEHSITHTEARRKAAKAGARIATMPGITENMLLQGAVTADYRQVERITNKVAELLDKGKNVVIQKEGFELRMSIYGRKAFKSTGRYLNKGETGNLPSGEAYIAPVEGSTQGDISVDVSIADIGRLENPIVLQIKDGLLQNAKNGVQAQKLMDMLNSDIRYKNVAELGIGTNPRAILTGNILEDEKKMGTIHIAFGSNHTFGGNVNAGIHIDAVISNAVVYIDDYILIKNGMLNID